MLERDGDMWLQGKCVRTKYKQVQNNSTPPIYKRSSLLVMLIVVEDAEAIFMLKSERTGNNTYVFQTWS